MADKKAIKSFLWGTLTGAAAGAVTALLLAPKPGKELRKDISDAAQKIGDKTAEVSRQAGAAVQSIARRTSELASDARQAAGRFVTDIRSRIGSDNTELKTESPDQSEESQERIASL